MNRSTRTLALLLLLATLGIAGITSAKNVAGNFGLKPTKTDCDGKTSYGYVATWQAPAGAKSWQVSTANCHRVGPAVCNAAGQCTAQVNACGTGPAWVQVIGNLDTYTQSQRVVAPWPYDANGKKKVC